MKNILAGIFSSHPPDPPKVGPSGGLDLIRAPVRAHVRYPESHAIFARETQIGSESVHAFSRGEDNLSDVQIAATLKHLNIRAAYNAERDVLVSTAPPATSTGVAPDPWISGSNVPGLTEMATAHLRARLAQLEGRAS